MTTFIAPPLLGDYNQDGVVDAADYIVWRNSLGAGTLPNRAPNNTGAISVADYNTWRQHFGQSVLGSGSSLKDAAVPEPATYTLYCWIIGAAFLSRGGRARLTL